MKERIYTVGQINHYIHEWMSADFLLRKIRIKGEVSNLKYHSSGHIYFTLKDSMGALNAIMFASDTSGLKFRLKDGDQVVVTGRIDVYMRTGTYQLYARSIEREGRGDLYERYERLKKELEETGMFSPEYKKAIPRYAMTVGIVTAPTGAAVRDIIQISRRRNPYVQLILCPALVQGNGAPQSIAEAITRLDGIHPDVMIVGRGGGSIEDLWAFNEEIVARAIFHCTTPVISAVGHETDTTIADFVADMRAPTPSAAAELAVFDYDQFRRDVRDRVVRLSNETLYTSSRYRARAKACARMLKSASPAQKLVHYHEKSTQIKRRLLLSSPLYLISQARQNAAQDEDRLNILMQQALDAASRRRAVAAARLEGLSPAGKLARGYSYVTDAGGHNIRSASRVKPKDLLHIYMASGHIDAETITVFKDTSMEADAADGTDEGQEG